MIHKKPCDHSWCNDRPDDEFVVAQGSLGDWLISDSALAELKRQVKSGSPIVIFMDKDTHLTVVAKSGSEVIQKIGGTVNASGRLLHIINI